MTRCSRRAHSFRSHAVSDGQRLGTGIAPSNELVISALAFGALCVAFPIFLILELGLGQSVSAIFTVR
jgi:hypothetical protein